MSCHCSMTHEQRKVFSGEGYGKVINITFGPETRVSVKVYGCRAPSLGIDSG